MLAINTDHKFIIHTEIACKYSPVFETLLLSKPDYYETNVHSGVLQRFVLWLYNQEIVLHQFHEKECEEEFCFVSRLEETEDLMQLMGLAAALQIPSLEDDILVKLEKVFSTKEFQFTELVEWVNIAYGCTEDGSPLREFMVGLCDKQDPGIIELKFYDLPTEFLLDFALYPYRDDMLVDVESCPVG